MSANGKTVGITGGHMPFLSCRPTNIIQALMIIVIILVCHSGLHGADHVATARISVLHQESQ